MQEKGDLKEYIMFSRPGDIVQSPTFDHFLNLMIWIGFLDPSLCMRRRYRWENGPFLFKTRLDIQSLLEIGYFRSYLKVELRKWVLWVCFGYFHPKKTPFLLDFVFFVSPAFAGFLVKNLGFHQQGAPFLPRPGEVVVKWVKTAHFCSQGNAMPPKHATTGRLKMFCTCKGCFKSLWCPHSCHWIITEVKSS